MTWVKVDPGAADQIAAMVDINAVYREIDGLIECIGHEGSRPVARWNNSIERPAFQKSAANLAHYMAFRHRDLRELQRSLMTLGLSSLGRLESRVLPTLLSVRATLAALAGLPAEQRPPAATYFAGEALLAERTREVLAASKSRRIALLVTCPAEAADTPSFMLELARHGVEALRINCAHDTADRWERMIHHARAAEKATGHRFKILMDLAGPKVRTGVARLPEGEGRIKKGDKLAIVPCGGLERVDIRAKHFAVECTLPEALQSAKVGDHIYVDDGKLGTKVERVEPWGLVTRVTRTSSKGARLKSEKGLNFPDTDLEIAALTEKDRADLDFIVAHADGIEFSFVQSVADVKMLQDELAKRRPDDWRSLSLILKIETAKAVRNLPDIVVAAAGRQPTAIMIARGDLAVEIGFGRMAEMQEEILWIGEAAQVPVIWATQVLEHLIRKGTPSRGEMTDAAMAARAECVMLNKGPYLFEALDELDALLGRMEQHQYKKTPRLRRLRSW